MFQNTGSLTLDIEMSGCKFNSSCKVVVPDFAAPGINKLGLLNHHSGYKGQVEIKDSKLLNSKKVASIYSLQKHLLKLFVHISYPG